MGVIYKYPHCLRHSNILADQLTGYKQKMKDRDLTETLLLTYSHSILQEFILVQLVPLRIECSLFGLKSNTNQRNIYETVDGGGQPTAQMLNVALDLLLHKSFVLIILHLIM